MTTCFLAPDPIQSTFFIPGGNTVANGAQLFFYSAGSSTKQTVYKDNAAAVAWTNPIVLDSGGNLPSGGEVWFPTGQTFKVIFAPSTDTDPPASPYWTKDNLSGINDTSASTSGEWTSGPSPTFVNATQFTVVGDQTGTFTAGRRLKTTNTGGTVYGVIVNAAFGTSTTVNVVNDSGALDSGLSAVSYGLLDPANPSASPAEINRKGAAVASAGNGTTNIWGTVGDYVHITGTNSIYNFSTAPYAGARREVIFDGILTLFTSGTFITPRSENIITAANDRASIRADTVSSAIITQYIPTSPTIKTGQFTFTMSSTASSQIVTTGFQPKGFVFLANGVSFQAVSAGFDDGSNTVAPCNSIQNNSGGTLAQWGASGTYSILVNTSSSNSYAAKVVSTSGTGFTVSTVPTGAPSGTLNVFYLAFR